MWFQEGGAFNDWIVELDKYWDTNPLAISPLSGKFWPSAQNLVSIVNWIFSFSH